MRKLLIVGIVVAASAAAYFVFVRREPAAAAEQGQQAEGQRGPGRGGQGGPGGGGFGGGGFGGPGGGGGFRPPMTVEVAKVSRGTISADLTVVGNLIGEATVDVVPRTGGRLTAMNVKLGDRVRRGQIIAKIEDREIVEQVQPGRSVAPGRRSDDPAARSRSQSGADQRRTLAQPVRPSAAAEADPGRRRSALHVGAVAQLDLSRAQLAQSAARLEELRINLANTNVVSPVDGFVGKRNVDPGAWVSQPAASCRWSTSPRCVWSPTSSRRICARSASAIAAQVEVDAYPGEKFTGRIARVAPVLDPATRTAPMEIEIPNAAFRLKPGMYARVDLDGRRQARTCWSSRRSRSSTPRVSAACISRATTTRRKFKPVKIGIEDNERAEILEGLQRGRDDRLHRRGRAAPRRPAGRRRRGDGRSPRRSRRGSRGDGRTRAARPTGGQGGRGGSAAVAASGRSGQRERRRRPAPPPAERAAQRRSRAQHGPVESKCDSRAATL